MNSVAAIVVTYNRKMLLRENLQALCKQSYEKLDILIIDNASTDGTYEYIKDLLNDARILYFNTGANLGGAGGFSYGIRLATEKGYSYCWIMDDDTIAEKDALSELIVASDKVENFSFLCSMVNWIDGNPCVMNKVNFSNDLYKSSQLLKNGIIPVQSCSFVSCFVNTDYVKKLGLPIRQFFIYGDDSEYTYRLSNSAPAYLVAKSVVVHKMKDNKITGIVYQGDERLDREVYGYRNLVYVKHNRLNKSYFRICGFYMKLIFDIIRFSPNSKIKKSMIVLKALIQGIKFKPDIEFPGDQL